ncbi:MAG: phosphoribosylglycinamide formyltransferase [Dysgonamonadaceae bacterium]|nr:phosphoribosylglycinamide formyltransferase [Dysgonamonadaceae bacterium]MDD3900878.1 phosphoribosylglycinamide formyltransferase [Dysgonamonadaceae bacterium]MDD4398511.1 phosphoribosylglycinamide formyltransferase [Dysgonamonadaceae bacterium]
MTNLAILASGNGTNAENIFRHFSSNNNINVVVVLSNKSNAYVHQRAANFDVPSFSFSKSEFDDGALILKTLKEYKVDFIVLAGFMIKLSTPILKEYPNKIINIHPALLPKFGGKGMYGDHVHKAVIEAGETQSGITIHYVNERYDEGQIIFQAKCLVIKGQTYEEVAQNVHALEYKYYPKIIEQIVNKTFNL